jgi:hypothetical protein
MVILQDEGQCQCYRPRLCCPARQAQHCCLLLRPGNHFGGLMFGLAMCGLPPPLAFQAPIMFGCRQPGFRFPPRLSQADSDRFAFGCQAPASFGFRLADRFQQGDWRGCGAAIRVHCPYASLAAIQQPM